MTSATPGTRISTEPAAAPRHTWVDDVAGIATGVVVASLGLRLLSAAGAVTGGTAGLALLLGHVLPWGFGTIYVVVNLPFLLLAGLRKGWGFAIRSVVAIALVSALTALTPAALPLEHLAPVYGTLVGNLLLGLAVLFLFRHGASLGGFTIVALLAQERLGWRAGWVQLGLDAVVLALSALVTPLPVVVASVAGDVVLNLVLAINHRPGRYLGA
jgi:uncharacterized membrane-anchored protein YitT (DUF2179 family)